MAKDTADKKEEEKKEATTGTDSKKVSRTKVKTRGDPIVEIQSSE